MKYKVQMQDLSGSWHSIADVEQYPTNPKAGVTPILREDGAVAGVLKMWESTIKPKLSETPIDKATAEALLERLTKEFPNWKFKIIHV